MRPLIRARLIPSNRQSFRQIRSNDRHIIGKARQSLEKLAKEDEHAIGLDQKPDKRPTDQNQQHAGPEGEGAAPFLFSREEGKGALRAEEERDADEEQNVAHGEQGAVEEEDHAEEEEEAAAAAEGDSDFCECLEWWLVRCFSPNCGGNWVDSYFGCLLARR